MLDDEEFNHFAIASAQLIQSGAIQPMQMAVLMGYAHRQDSRCQITNLDVKEQMAQAGLSEYVAEACIHQYFFDVEDGVKNIGPVDLGSKDIPVLAAIKATKPDGTNLLTGEVPQHLTAPLLEIIEAAADAAGVSLTDTAQSYLRSDGHGNLDIVEGGVSRAFNGVTSAAIDKQAEKFLQEMKDNPFFASVAPPDDWGSPDPDTRKENPHAPDQ